MPTREEMIRDAQELKDLGYEDQAIQLLEQVDRMPPPGFSVRGHNFGADDSVILSSLYHPVEAIQRGANWLGRQVDIASGQGSPYDNPNPLQAPNMGEQAQAAFNLSTLASTGAMPFAPKGSGGTLGHILNPFSRTKAAVAKINEVMPQSTGGNAPFEALAGKNPYPSLTGVKPTAGMLSSDPRILQLESNARNTDPAFWSRDQQNLYSIYQANLEKALPDESANLMQERLNSRTGSLRDEAFDAARDKDFHHPLVSAIAKIRTQPGMRKNAGAQKLADAAEQVLAVGENEIPLQPEDLYDFRKTIDDALKMKTLSADDLSNAAKNNRRVSVLLKSAIDRGLNQASGGKFGEYLTSYKEGIAPIEEGRAVQNVLDRFVSSTRIKGTDVPEMTPAAYRRAVDNLTYTNLGKAGYADKLSGTTRQIVDDTSRALSDLQGAKKGSVSVLGSPTTSFLAGLAKRGLDSATPGGSLLFNFARALGQSRGSLELADALLNPHTGRLDELLRLYGERGIPYGEIVKKAAAAAQNPAMRGSVLLQNNR